MKSFLKCLGCGSEFNEPDQETLITCPKCSSLLEVIQENLAPSFSGHGVWRYRSCIGDFKQIVSMQEGSTPVYFHPSVDSFAGAEVLLKHEGMNPTCSFKDRGMTVALSLAKKHGIREVCCASTGNTSSSMAAYSSYCGISSNVFVPKGKVTGSKIYQTMAYGAKITEVDGTFDQAMDRIMSSSTYTVNSINPWRIEGQKTLAYELYEHCREKKIPLEWIAIPGGNLGNSSALCKGFLELQEMGLLDSLPSIAIIQAKGASPLYNYYKSKKFEPVNPSTIASAINIGNPRNFPRIRRAMKELKIVVEAVSDQEIISAKRVIDSSGIGCEPASACSLAGVKKLRASGVLESNGSGIFCILTGHMLKDTQTVGYSIPGQQI